MKVSVDMNYKIFCDESCHLQNDGWDVMVLGALKCPEDEYEKIKADIKAIKLKHKTPFEIKWQKLSNSRIELYKELIDYFMDSNLTYRAVIVINKRDLDHHQFSQTHSEFYYKTYYLVLKKMMQASDTYKIYMDFKDTKGREALDELTEIFNNSKELPLPYMQHIRADESQLIQLADLFTGAVSYKNRDLDQSETKQTVIAYLEERLGLNLDMTSPYKFTKFNLFIQDPKKVSK